MRAYCRDEAVDVRPNFWMDSVLGAVQRLHPGASFARELDLSFVPSDWAGGKEAAEMLENARLVRSTWYNYPLRALARHTRPE